MKNTFFLWATCLWSVSLVAQTPIYLEFSPDCMNRLEYRYKGQSTGSSIYSYSIRPNSQQLFVFDIGAEGNMVMDRLPGSVVSCKNFRFDVNLVQSINAGNQKIHIARRVKNGWLVSPVASAELIHRSGSIYEFHTVNAHFSVDTLALDYGVNLARSGSGAYIFYNGSSNFQDGCHRVYSFHREPDDACRTKTDFDFIPGIGTISERTGMTSEEASNNEFRLVSVNGVQLESYLLAICRGQKLENQYVVAEESNIERPAVTYQYTASPPLQQPSTIGQPDKEKAVEAFQNPLAPVEHVKTHPTPKMGPWPATNCPEKPGEGYHIVQPGETLASISRAYGVKLGLVIAWNNIKQPDLIKPCQKIYLTIPPGGMKPPIDANTNKVAVASKITKHKCPCDYVRPNVFSHSTPLASAATKKNLTTAPRRKAIPAAKPGSGIAKTSAPAPVQHSTVSTETALAARTVVRPPATYSGIVHTVKSGETLYSIAKLYGFTAERFAKMNGIALNFALQPGMQLVTSDCSCNANGQPTDATAVYSAAIPSKSTQTATAKGGTNNAQVFEEKQLQPNQYGSNNPSGFQIATKTTSITTAGATKTRGHYVQSGETLSDIARKYNVSPERIAQANGMDMREILVIGMRIIIPD